MCSAVWEDCAVCVCLMAVLVNDLVSSVLIPLSSADEPNQTFQLLLVAQLNLRRRSPSKPVEGGLASAYLWPPTLNIKKKVVE